MDPNQNGAPPPPPGYSASDVVPSTTTSAPPPPPGYSSDQVVATTPKPPAAVPNSLHIDDNDPWYMKAAKGVNAVGAGIGQGVLSTLGGALHLADKVTGTDPSQDTWTQTIDQKQKELAQQNRENPTLNGFGYGGETLVEFLTGDEALKGMSLADQTAHVAKALKVVEGSERMMQALKIGAAALKQGARAGAVQGVQSLVRTGGDVGQSAKDALTAGATTAALGAGTGALSSVLGKGADAAGTIDEMNQRAQTAPTADENAGTLNQTVNDAYNNETGTLQNNLDDATSTIQMAGEGAPSQSSITTKAQKMVAERRKQLSDAYVAGLQKLKGLIDSDPENPTTIPHIGSPLQQTAQSLLNEGAIAESPLDEGLGKSRPGSARANQLLQSWANLGQEAEEEEEPKSAHNLLDEFINSKEVPAEASDTAGNSDEPEGPKLNLQQLTEARRALGERMRNLGYTSADDNADRQIYKKLIQGVDDSIAQLADTSQAATEDGAGAVESESGDFEPEEGDEEAPTTPASPAGTQARQILDKMNAQYRNGIRLFQNSDVKSLLKGNINDIGKKLMAGQTSLDDIAAVKKVLGPTSFKTLSDASLQNMIKGAVDDSGDLDYKKLFKQWQKINPDVRTQMFGGTGDSLSKALQTAVGSSNALDEIGKNVQSLLGNGDLETLVKSPDKIKALAATVGPDGMKTLGQSLLEQKIGEAASRLDPKTGEFVKDRFDPDKLLDWWNSFKDNPEVRDALFHPDAQTKQQYADLMKRVGQASSVKKLVKYGLLPAAVGTAGSVHGPVAALVAATAGLGAEGFGSAKGVLDHIANNPRTWKLLQTAGKGAEALHSAPLSQTTKRAAGSVLANALSGATDNLSGNNDQGN